MINSIVQKFCTKRQISTLVEAHAFLTNTNKITLLLKKYQMFYYSFEQNIEAIRHYVYSKVENVNNQKVNIINILKIHF